MFHGFPLSRRLTKLSQYLSNVRRIAGSSEVPSSPAGLIAIVVDVASKSPSSAAPGM